MLAPFLCGGRDEGGGERGTEGKQASVVFEGPQINGLLPTLAKGWVHLDPLA